MFVRYKVNKSKSHKYMLYTKICFKVQHSFPQCRENSKAKRRNTSLSYQHFNRQKVNLWSFYPHKVVKIPLMLPTYKHHQTRITSLPWVPFCISKPNLIHFREVVTAESCHATPCSGCPDRKELNCYFQKAIWASRRLWSYTTLSKKFPVKSL